MFLVLQVIKVFNEDNSSRAVEVERGVSARDICQMFIMKNCCIDDHCWTLFEHLPHLDMGKVLSPTTQRWSCAAGPILGMFHLVRHENASHRQDNQHPSIFSAIYLLSN